MSGLGVTLSHARLHCTFFLPLRQAAGLAVVFLEGRHWTKAIVSALSLQCCPSYLCRQFIFSSQCFVCVGPTWQHPNSTGSVVTGTKPKAWKYKRLAAHSSQVNRLRSTDKSHVKSDSLQWASEPKLPPGLLINDKCESLVCLLQSYRKEKTDLRVVLKLCDKAAFKEGFAQFKSSAVTL